MSSTSANRLTTAKSGINGDNLGASGGLEDHTLTEAQMPDHTHTYSESSSGPAASGVGAGFSPPTTVGRQEVDSGSTGGGSAHNNVQPTIILNYIIKT